MDNKLQAADAYVLALRTGEIPASQNASQYLAPDVVLTVGSAARKNTVSGYDDVLARISGEWPNTPVFVKGFWSAARLEGDKARVDATFPPMGAAPGRSASDLLVQRRRQDFGRRPGGRTRSRRHSRRTPFPITPAA